MNRLIDPFEQIEQLVNPEYIPPNSPAKRLLDERMTPMPEEKMIYLSLPKRGSRIRDIFIDPGKPGSDETILWRMADGNIEIVDSF